MLPADSSQNQIIAPAADSSQTSGVTAPVPAAGGNGDTSVAPNNPAIPPSPVTPAPADTGAPGSTGVAPNSQEEITPENYAARKAAYLASKAANQAPAPAQVPEPTPAPAPAPVSEPTRQPTLNVRPRNDAELQEIVAFRDYQKSGGTLSLIQWGAAEAARRNPAPASTPAPTAAPAPNPTPAPVEPVQGEVLTAAQIRQRLSAISEEMASAGQAFDLPTIAKLTAEQGQLSLAMADAVQADARAAQQAAQSEIVAAQQFEQQVDDAIATARRIYGSAVDAPNSALNQAAAVVLQEARDAGNPAAATPEFVHAMYAMAAARINYVPSSNGNPAPAPLPALVPTPVLPGTPPSVVADGAQRATIAQRTTNAPITTMAEYEAAKAAVLARR